MRSGRVSPQKKWQDVFPTFATSGYAYPWEDIELTETAAAEK